MLQNKLKCHQGDGMLDVKTAFSAFDDNESGVVTSAEFAHALSQLGFNLSRTQLQILLRYLDSNNDGMIDYSEFLKFFAGTCHGQGIEELDLEAEQRQRIKDSNERLEVGVRESLKRLKVGPSLRRQFRRFDRDGSGGLEYGELADMVRMLGFNITSEQQDHLWKCMSGGDPQMGARVGYAGLESFVEGLNACGAHSTQAPVSAAERQRGGAVLRRLRRAADQRRVDIAAPFRLRMCSANTLDDEEIDINGFYDRVKQLDNGKVGDVLTRQESNGLFRGAIAVDAEAQQQQRGIVSARQVLEVFVDREDLLKKWKSKSGLRSADEHGYKVALVKVLERALGSPAEGLTTCDELVRTLRQLGFARGTGGAWQLGAVADLCIASGGAAGFGPSARVDWSVFVDLLFV
jgi:calcium-binding protein CML